MRSKFLFVEYCRERAIRVFTTKAEAIIFGTEYILKKGDPCSLTIHKDSGMIEFQKKFQ